MCYAFNMDAGNSNVVEELKSLSRPPSQDKGDIPVSTQLENGYATLGSAFRECDKLIPERMKGKKVKQFDPTNAMQEIRQTLVIISLSKRTN